ncbi:hypothetical protein RXV94_05525 [Yeosuana sp. MJ-SS3]|uniref:GLPGLI family protein n=1 Tax=Gilvirhabdus luticola TaxID=3079858 RepID=A0ABU3U5C8_9FLAO|nr:hypothetical protein [Yeosuana sp. MJ-SS3]MDU8885610.1 hypothetical protein [Yeosuana sp. MJ-SS3]
MKKFLALFVVVSLSFSAIAQDDLFLVFELMKVDNEQEQAYWETENFWEKIHQQRVNNGDIVGWDLWQLSPGGETQGFQYMTVTLFNSAKGMFQGGNFMENVKKAYPDLSEEDLRKKFEHTSKSRDLAVRIYLRQIATTTNESFDMPLGSIAFINYMKVEMGKYGAYEKAETEVFQPMHQKSVDDGNRSAWGLLRFMLPYGSDVYATHITYDMYKDIDQAISDRSSGMGTLTEAQQKAVQDGIATRDLKSGVMGTLVKKVR